MVVSESSFGAYVCHRRPAGLHRNQRLLFPQRLLSAWNRWWRIFPFSWLVKFDVQWYYPGRKKTTTWIMHKIRTLFVSRNITRLARWRSWPRLLALLHRSAVKLDFSISHDRNRVLILCIIQVAISSFFFLAKVVFLSSLQRSIDYIIKDGDGLRTRSFAGTVDL